MRKNEKRNGKALLPIVVFVVLYLGLGILFEYGLDIEMGFYKIPVVVIFLVALLVACIQNRELKLNDKLELLGRGISDPNYYYNDHNFYAVRYFCRYSRKNIRKQCCIFYFVTGSASVCSCCAFCGQLFCFSCNGYLCRNNYTDRSNWSCSSKGIRICTAGLYWFCHERRHVWR